MTISAWQDVVDALHVFDTFEGERSVAVQAAEQLHRLATHDDVPLLLVLLQDESFFIREAAAWPLSELAGAKYVRELLQAYQRGFDDGHDNDGFSAALADMAAADPCAVRQALQPFITSTDESTQRNANWLLQFCQDGK